MITQVPKGTKDWYGVEMQKRRKIEQIARSLCDKFNIKEVSTPIFEHTELFLRSVGETTDVVQKEMYTFLDKGNRSITLKPEGTAGAARAYLENSLFAEPQPIKVFYVTPVFRYENPAKGRLRQHHQFGVEFYGSASPLAEVEVITLLKNLIEQLGIKDATLHINSIGCSSCRAEYNKVLMEYLEQNKDKLCSTCRERMEKNPLRVLDCKVPTCHEITKTAPRSLEYLDEECTTHFEQLKSLLTELGIEYVVNTNIVRGLDYYTKTVFEFLDTDGFTLSGGGRYDNLIKQIDGKQDIPAVGFGIGIERILYFLEKDQVELDYELPIDLYVGILGNEATAKAYALVTKLRLAGAVVETDYLGRSVKAQMKYANKLGAKNTVIFGANELSENKANVKNMATGEQTELALDEIYDYIIKTRV